MWLIMNIQDLNFSHIAQTSLNEAKENIYSVKELSIKTIDITIDTLQVQIGLLKEAHSNKKDAKLNKKKISELKKDHTSLEDIKKRLSESSPEKMDELHQNVMIALHRLENARRNMPNELSSTINKLNDEVLQKITKKITEPAVAAMRLKIATFNKGNEGINAAINRTAEKIAKMNSVNFKNAEEQINELKKLEYLMKNDLYLSDPVKDNSRLNQQIEKIVEEEKNLRSLVLEKKYVFAQHQAGVNQLMAEIPPLKEQIGIIQNLKKTLSSKKKSLKEKLDLLEDQSMKMLDGMTQIEEQIKKKREQIHKLGGGNRNEQRILKQDIERLEMKRKAYDDLHTQLVHMHSEVSHGKSKESLKLLDQQLKAVNKRIEIFEHLILNPPSDPKYVQFNSFANGRVNENFIKELKNSDFNNRSEWLMNKVTELEQIRGMYNSLFLE